MIFPIESKDGSCQGIDSDGQAVGVVLMTFKEGQVGRVCPEGKFPGQGHAHKHKVKAPDGVIFTRLVWGEDVER